MSSDFYNETDTCVYAQSRERLIQRTLCGRCAQYFVFGFTTYSMSKMVPARNADVACLDMLDEAMGET